MQPTASQVLALRARESTYPGAAEHVSTVRADLRPLLHDCPVADEVILCASEFAANAATHGLRAKKALLYFESYAGFNQLCRELTAEWLPQTPTECTLVEDMAVARLKLVRLESNLSHAFYQSFVMKSAAAKTRLPPPTAPSARPTSS